MTTKSTPITDTTDFSVRGPDELRGSDKPQSFIITKYLHARVGSGNAALMKSVEDGKIYDAGRRQPRDIRKCTAEMRRAWCRLTGVTNANLDLATRRFAEEEQKQRNAGELEEVQEDALRLGYKLVPIEEAGVKP